MRMIWLAAAAVAWSACYSWHGVRQADLPDALTAARHQIGAGDDVHVTLTLLDGTELKGVVRDPSPDRLTLVLPDGRTQTFAWTEVARLEVRFLRTAQTIVVVVGAGVSAVPVVLLLLWLGGSFGPILAFPLMLVETTPGEWTIVGGGAGTPSAVGRSYLVSLPPGDDANAELRRADEVDPADFGELLLQVDVVAIPTRGDPSGEREARLALDCAAPNPDGG